MDYKIVSDVFLVVAANHNSIEVRCEIDEDIFTAGNCETTHWMIESKFFLSFS